MTVYLQSSGDFGARLVAFCPVCGSADGTAFKPVMWPELGDQWGLSAEEYSYIDHQQGEVCVHCKSNLRSQALAYAVLTTVNYCGTFRSLCSSIRGRMTRILEINTAGDISRCFRRWSFHELREWPSVDMMNMADIPTGRYDLVIHSDTLEHVPDPIKGLSECCRVLRPGGACCFTVPIVVGRLTRSRHGLPPSCHGRVDDPRQDYLVHTEYGADAWRHVLAAGFAECRIVAVQTPVAHAIVAVKRKK